MGGRVVYQGRDLEAMGFAVNYHRWILEVFSPHLGERLVEVGAGAGSFSELLLERPIKSLSAVEPSAEMFPLLEARLGAVPTSAEVTTYNALFREAAGEIKRGLPDSIIYVNVLEHIEDDEGELAAAWAALRPGGKLFIFVPAFPWLYGGFDRAVGHVRRYGKAELEGKCRRAGFRIILSRYFDLAGVVPWWVRYRLFKSSSLDAASVRLYDRLAVNILKVLESKVSPPFGKNIILVAER